jgi:hypothetical protein
MLFAPPGDNSQGYVFCNRLFVEDRRHASKLKEELHLLKMLTRKVDWIYVIKTG